MAQLTISNAARACRVARSTLQRAINAGRLSLDADHQVDTAELLRVGYTLHAAQQEETRRTHAAGGAPGCGRALHSNAAGCGRRGAA